MTFETAVSLAPGWEAFREKMVPEGGGDVEFKAEAQAFIPMLSNVASRCEALLRETFDGAAAASPS